MIRKINIDKDCFSRQSLIYFSLEESSLLEKYKGIDGFDIEAIEKAFIDLKKISAHDKHFHNCSRFSKRSYFIYKETYKEQDYAMLILSNIKSYLNIFHVFYIRLYASYGEYTSKDQLISIALSHIHKIKDEDNLKVIFASVLLFLSMIDDWKSAKESPVLPQETANRLIEAFEKLLISQAIDRKTKFFIQILFLDFMTYFEMRGYLTQFSNKEEEPSILTVISPNGFVKKLKIYYNINFQTIYQQICKQLYSTSPLRGIDRFETFFKVWHDFLRNPSLEISSFLSPVEPDFDSDQKPLFFYNSENVFSDQPQKNFDSEMNIEEEKKSFYQHSKRKVEEEPSQYSKEFQPELKKYSTPKKNDAKFEKKYENLSLSPPESQAADYQQATKPLIFSNNNNRKINDDQLEIGIAASQEIYQKEHGPFKSDSELKENFEHFKQEMKEELKRKKKENTNNLKQKA